MSSPPAGACSRSHAYRPTKISTIIGTPTAHQDRKSTDRPSTSGRRIYPKATTLVAVPIGVATPPTHAPDGGISSGAVGWGVLEKPAPRQPARTLMMPAVTGHIRAAAAALLIH